MAVMAMFPLGMTLLPGAALPLQVFEERYRVMVRDLLAADTDPLEFGVTLIERGQEVGGGDQRASVGTIARIVDIRALPDGRYTLMAVGAERCRVLAWLDDDPYPRAEIEPWPDETGDEVASAIINTLSARVQELNEIVGEVTGTRPPERPETVSDQRLAVYQLASIAPLGPADRHRVLLAASLAARVTVLDDALDDAMAGWEFRRS